MNIEAFTQWIDAHPSSHHDVFHKLASRKWPPAVLAAYLREMGAFCAASRDGGIMHDVLRIDGYETAGAMIGSIFAGEQFHAIQFADMARALLAGTVEAEQDWERFPVSSPSHAIRWASAIFAMRKSPAREKMLYSLGALLVVEHAANRQIIPGEITAFVHSGFYGPSMENTLYLLEHGHEGNVEEQHEDHVKTVLSMLELTPQEEERVHRGCSEMLDALQAFYDELDRILTV